MDLTPNAPWHHCGDPFSRPFLYLSAVRPVLAATSLCGSRGEPAGPPDRQLSAKSAAPFATARSGSCWRASRFEPFLQDLRDGRHPGHSADEQDVVEMSDAP